MPMTPPMPPKILIVEDEHIVARDLLQQLQELGYNAIGHAVSGEQGIELASRLKPDLVLMDIQLSGAIDGIEAAQQIRAKLNLPVVFLTAFAADEVLARAKLTEPFGYILKPFTERELRTVLEMALYKHKAEQGLAESAAQLRALSRRVLEVQETERRRLALELHDELGQSLTAIKINLQSQARFRAISPEALGAENIRIVDDALQQVRRLAMALRPSMLDDLGLAPALRWLAEQAAERSAYELQFQALMPPERLAPEIETTFFRIAQEALTNIARHARATQLEVVLQQSKQDLVMTIHDNGCGFDPGISRDQAMAGASLGMLGMQERAMLIGANLTIESSPGRGCMLLLNCPLRPAEVKP
ncbi:response regulator [Roseateles oligotrophus]|uniref:histidine kinase n=1 Tax=Roseateles oligotrophus TaxID=1769250 RepID=A0ABT2YFS8_9BURK|nr:response regulator [Roseateles oligotrophus]MCV2368915.1 response regulator [Roseateles oligotrophus]